MNQINKVREFKVIKLAKLMESTKNEGELLFKDESGRIYFMDKKSNHDIVSEFDVGEYYYVWVVKEVVEVGYVKTNVNGKCIADYLISLVELTYTDYLDINVLGRDDAVFITNYMYNHDIEFNKYLKNDNCETTDSPTISMLFNHYDRIGINSEVSEFIYEKAVLDNYLISRKYWSVK